MIKAAAGGGGRGIRTAHEMADVERLLPLASAEGMAAFGDGGVYVEKIIEKARHIEVQILGDGKRVLHCFERECSLQRRRQKVRGSTVSYSAAFHQRGALPFGCGFGRVRIEAPGQLNILTTTFKIRFIHRNEHPDPGRTSRE